MIKFCPMCGERIPSETAKFYMGCGLNLVEYRKKLERLSAGESSDKNNSPRETKVAPKKTVPQRPHANESQASILSLHKRFGYLRKVYFQFESTNLGFCFNWRHLNEFQHI